MRVKEWLHAQMITRAKQALTWPVPNSKGKVAEQMFDTFLTPRPVRSEKQLHIRRPKLNLLGVGGQLGDQLALCVNARIRPVRVGVLPACCSPHTMAHAADIP